MDVKRLWYEQEVERLHIDEHGGPASARTLAAVAVGGAVGAGLRWAVGAAWEHDRGAWPWSTLVVNVIGCVAIGVAARRLRLGTLGWAFVVTGVLGGFTTFSSFAIEVDDLFAADRALVALGYIAVTLTAGTAATWIALRERWRP